MISIIIPTYYEEQFIERLLKSIKRQNYKDYEIIVADNHSTDRTREKALEYGAQVVDGGIPSIARNRGAEKAKGEYLLFIDADQVLPKTFLLRLLKKMKKDSVDICVPALRPLDSKNIFYKILFGFHAIYLKVMEKIKPQGSGACIFTTSKLHKKIKGFDETRRLSEDHDYIFRSSQLGKFKMYNDIYILFSVRRIEDEGLLLSLFKIIKAAFLFMLTGKSDENVEYEFGKFRNKPVISLDMIDAENWNIISKIQKLLLKIKTRLQKATSYESNY